MKITAAKYYIIVTGLFFAVSYFLGGTEQLLQMPLFYMVAGPAALFFRFYISIFDLSHILKHRHKVIFEQHVFRWVIGWSGKIVTPTCIFSETVNGINDLDVKQIVTRSKMNLLFTLISIVTLPFAVFIIMAWR